MYYGVTVDQAIRRGKRMISYPIIIIAFVGLIICTGLVISGLISWVLMLVGMLLSFLIPILYWSVMITHWRLWAFDNVRNVHELKKRAINNQLIWPDNSFFEKVEIQTASQRRKWLSLLDRFKTDDVFQEDFTIPSETIIYYSPKKALISIFISALVIVTMCVFYADESKPRVWWHIIISVITLIVYYRQFKNSKQQIILNNEGIKTANVPFFTWAEVRDENVVVVHNHFAHNSVTYFKFNTPVGQKNIEISDFDISVIDFEKLIIAYRARYNNKLKKT